MGPLRLGLSHSLTILYLSNIYTLGVKAFTGSKLMMRDELRAGSRLLLMKNEITYITYMFAHRPRSFILVYSIDRTRSS